MDKMTTLVKWGFMLVAYGVGVSLVSLVIWGCTRPFFEKWYEYKRKRDARVLKSYTVWVKEENMGTKSIESVLQMFNEDILDKHLVELEEVLGITYSPHMNGHQFTMWFRERSNLDVSIWADFIGKFFVGLGNSYYHHGRNDNFGRNNFNRKYP